MKHETIKLSKCDDRIEIGRRYIKVEGKTYKVGDIVEKLIIYISNESCLEADVKLTSTNVSKKTASFRVITNHGLKLVK